MNAPVSFRLFVYGTFMSGEREHDMLAGAERKGAAKTVKGFTLVETRALAGMLQGGDGDVVGEVYEVGYETLRACDKRRDHPSLYERREIELSDGTRAHAYLLRADQARGLRRIKGGDWKKRFAVDKPEAPPLVQWARARHRR